MWCGLNEAKIYIDDVILVNVKSCLQRCAVSIDRSIDKYSTRGHDQYNIYFI